MGYIPRVVDGELNLLLKAAGAVVIEGPKACGKTASALQQATSSIMLDTDPNAEQLYSIDPAHLLAGSKPRLLDEWQLFPKLWNLARREIDNGSIPGQFILTGSATPTDDYTRHSGAGRFSQIKMRPMSLFETGESNGSISLTKLLNGTLEILPTISEMQLTKLVDLIIKGGWPAQLNLDTTTAQRLNRDYLDRIARTDISTVDGVSRDPLRVTAVMSSLARGVASQIKVNKIAADSGLNRNSTQEYLQALSRLMVIEDQPAWNTHLRSSHRLQTTPTRHFVCPSLAAAALNASNAALLNDLETLGLLFESMVIRDLRVYSQPRAGEVLHYRDSTGLEVDAIVDCRDRYAAFEVKLGQGKVDEAAKNLLEFANKLDTSKRNGPVALSVIVSSGLAHTRPDGVHVIPIGMLGP